MSKRNLLFISQCLLALISPLAALPFTLYSIYRGDFRSLYVFAYIIAVYICILVPFGDAYHYYMIFQNADWTSFQHDYLFVFLSIICKRMGISYYMLRFALVISSLCLLMNICINLCRESNYWMRNTWGRVMLFIALICACDCWMTSSGVRFGIMKCWLVYGIFLLSRQKYTMAVMLFILATLMHFSCLMFLPFVLIGLYFRNTYFSPSKKLFLAICCWVAGGLLFDFVYPLLPLSWHHDTYVNGYWSDFANVYNLNGQIYYITRSLVIPSIAAFIFLITKKLKTSLSNITFFLILLFFIFWDYDGIRKRVDTISSMLIILSFLQYKYIRKIHIFLLCFLFAISQLMQIYSYRNTFFTVNALKYFTLPVMYVTQADYDEAYFFMRNIR